ncbi:hypothetical protein [Faecalibaculum rodentium]|uniref:hypothetical protein n=1 Tax=Faecalibaculum rodentium TaxID=1702221 RepID=UPI0025B751D2|nr:hypothetical protein [Faecalibaculum rodentium]
MIVVNLDVFHYPPHWQLDRRTQALTNYDHCAPWHATFRDIRPAPSKFVELLVFHTHPHCPQLLGRQCSIHEMLSSYWNVSISALSDA